MEAVGDLAVMPDRVGGAGAGGATGAGGAEGSHSHGLLMGNPTALPNSAPLPVTMDGLAARLDSDGIATVSGGTGIDGLAVSVGIPGMPDMSAAPSGGLDGGVAVERPHCVCTCWVWVHHQWYAGVILYCCCICMARSRCMCGMPGRSSAAHPRRQVYW